MRKPLNNTEHILNQNHNSTLIISINWPPETFLERLINGLADRGCTLTLATETQPPYKWLTQANRSWIWMPSWNAPHIRRFTNLIRLTIRFLSKERGNRNRLLGRLNRNLSWKQKLQATYTLLPFGGIRAGVVYFPWVLAASRFLEWFSEQGVPIVVSLRGSMINIDPYVPPQSKKIRSELREIFSRAAIVHCVSQDILDEAIYLGLDPEKAVVIRPAVDPCVFLPLPQPTPGTNFRIITTGSLIWRKGYEYALITMRQLINHGVNAELHIIGDGPERQRIYYTIQDLGLDRCVILHGKQSPAQVVEQLQKSDAFLLSSLSEGISNAALEAMSCGLPVVSADCGGMREAITNGVEGFLTPLRDPEAAASALHRLALDPELRLRMGQAARERIIRDFSLDQQIHAFMDLFQSVSQKQP